MRSSEEILAALWALIGYQLPRPVPRMTYADAMSRFGSDKPDLRFGIELVECTDYFKDTPFRVFQAPYVGAVVMPGGASQPRRTLDGWQEWAKQRGARGLAYVLIGDDGELGGPVAKNLSDAERSCLASHVGAKPGDCVFFAAGPVKPSRALLGAARGEIARRLDMVDPNAWAFLRPILKENGGWALFITTPRGRNHVKGMYDMARSNPHWFCEKLTVDDTHQVTEAQIEEARKISQ